MPLSGPPPKRPNLLICERNTAVQGATNTIDYDTFYDAAQAAIAAGAARTAAFAAIGLTYTAGVCAATETGLWLARFSFGAVAETGADIKVAGFVTSGYFGGPQTKWGLGLSAQDRAAFEMPNDEEGYIEHHLYMVAGNTFSTQVIASAGAVDVVDYAVLEIYRLL